MTIIHRFFRRQPDAKALTRRLSDLMEQTERAEQTIRYQCETLHRYEADIDQLFRRERVFRVALEEIVRATLPEANAYMTPEKLVEWMQHTARIALDKSFMLERKLENGDPKDAS